MHAVNAWLRARQNTKPNHRSFSNFFSPIYLTFIRTAPSIPTLHSAFYSLLLDLLCLKKISSLYYVIMMVLVTTFIVLCLGAYSLSAPSSPHHSTHCYSVDSIQLDNSDKVWMWSSFVPLPKVGNRSYKPSLYHSDWLMFVTRARHSYTTVDIIELAHQDERDPTKCRLVTYFSYYELGIDT